MKGPKLEMIMTMMMTTVAFTTFQGIIYGYLRERVCMCEGEYVSVCSSLTKIGIISFYITKEKCVV